MASQSWNSANNHSTSITHVRRMRQSRRKICLLTACFWIFAVLFWVEPAVTRAEEENVPQEDSPINRNTPLYWHDDPHLIVSTVDGSIGILRAVDGSITGGFRSGDPLVGPSEVLSGGRRIVPGLDSRLYVSLEHQEGLLQPLEITVEDVLRAPVKTCASASPNSNLSGCGIVTATKATTLFALDAHTGRLVWQQSPNGTTVRTNQDEDQEVATVLLQREDVLVQQLSADSGDSVWNVTLGTLQALEFGEDSGPGSMLPNGRIQRLLPSGSSSTASSRQLLMQDYVQTVDLPSVAFGSDGTSLTAVSQRGQVLWKQDFSTVIASVFGLHDRSWKTLTVLDDPEAANTRPGDNLGLGSNPLSSTASTDPRHHRNGVQIYSPPLFQRLSLLWNHPTSVFQGLVEEWFHATGEHRARQSNFFFSSENNHLLAPPKQTMTPLFHNDILALPRQGQHQQTTRLALPSSTMSPERSGSFRQGVFLTWPIILAICVLVVGVAGIVFRYLYLQKKSKWMQMLEQVGQMGFEKSAKDQSGEDSTSGRPTLKRSNSLPNVGFETSTVRLRADSTSDFESRKRRLRSESLQAYHTQDGKLVYDKELQDGTKKTSKNPPPSLETITDTLQEEKSSLTKDPQGQGVGFLVDGIPLIRYNRYDSEFKEVMPLGKGGFGTVFRCQNVLDGREYAIKKVALKHNTKLPIAEFRLRLQRTLREVKSLALLDHPNIVRYYTAWLELQKDDGTTAGANKPVGDSDYYLFSPSNTVDPSRLPAHDLDSKSQQPNNFSSRYRNMTNPLGVARGGFQEEFSDHFVPGVPEALDEYGFTFDRGEESENKETEPSNPGKALSAVSPTVSSQNLLAAIQDQSKSFGFSPPRGTIQEYASYQSNGSAESSIEESVSQETWSRESQSRTEGASTMGHLESETADNKSSKPSSMIRHILYIQMQFCSQKTLADFLNNPVARQGSESEGSVDIPLALNLFLQIAQGVQHVHGQGLIHRDLKPNNCFMDESAVKVGDFGLSRESTNEGRENGFDDDSSEENQDEALDVEITAGVGTRSYASPEQMKGSDYDSSTDIYSLGIILFELCYPMYTGMERMIVLTKLREHEFPDQWMQTVEPTFPTLHTLLNSMMSKVPADRPSAETVVRSIQGILEGYTISSIDKQHHDTSTLLRVEAKPRQDVLRHTIDLIKGAANPESIDIVQYGLRGGTKKAVMEFAISSSTCSDRLKLGNKLVKELGKTDEILLIRQVYATKDT